MSTAAPTVQEIQEAFEKTKWSKPSSPRAVLDDKDTWFVANLPLYIPALLKAASRRPLPWVERPSAKGQYWMRTKAPYEIVYFNDDKCVCFFSHGTLGAEKISDYPDARFQGPIAPDEGGEER